MVNNLEEVIVHNPKEVFSILGRSGKKRQVAETKLNKNSSRSHCVFTITVHTKEPKTDGEDIIKTGKLHLVDLAGSECVGRSGAREKHAKEAGNINKSLLTLGRVINSLVDNSGYIPYRDSKLTRLLQESLGGTCKTVIVATIGPSSLCIDETISTLDYAQRAKFIKNRPQVNHKMTRQAYMRELLMEITVLKRENEAQRTKNGVYMPTEDYEEMQNDLTSKKKQLEEFDQAMEKRKEELQKVQVSLTNTSTELMTMTAHKHRLEKELAETQTKLSECEARLQKEEEGHGATQQVLADTQQTLKETQDELAKEQREHAQTVGVLTQTQRMLKETQQHLAETQQQLSETEFLLSKHQATEKALTEQAAVLKQKLEESLADSAELHTKIETQTMIATRNQQAAAQLKLAMSKQAETLQAKMSAYVSSHSEAHLNMQKMYESFMQQKEQSYSALSTQVSTACAAIQGQHATLKSLCASTMSTFTDAITTQTAEGQQAKLELLQQVSSLEKSIAEQLQGVQLSITQQQQQLTSFRDFSVQSNQLHRATISKHVSEQQEMIESLKQKLATNHATSTDKLAESDSYMTSFVSQQEELFKAQNEALMSTVKDLLATHYQQQQAALQSADSAMKAFHSSHTDALAAQQQEATQWIDASVKHSNDIQATMEQQLVEHNKTVADAHYQPMMTGADGMTAATEALSTQAKSESAAISTALTATGERMETNMNGWTSEFTSFVDQYTPVSAEADTQTKTLSADCEAALSAMKSADVGSSQAFNTSIEAEVETTQQYQSQAHANVDACATLSDTFVDTEYASYEATASTPRKEKKFVFPTDFAATQAHASLLDGFRANTPLIKATFSMPIPPQATIDRQLQQRETLSDDSVGTVAVGEVEMAADAAVIDVAAAEEEEAVVMETEAEPVSEAAEEIDTADHEKTMEAEAEAATKPEPEVAVETLVSENENQANADIVDKENSSENAAATKRGKKSGKGARASRRTRSSSRIPVFSDKTNAK